VQRLVIALTTLLSLTAAAVIGGYLFLFAAQPDRAAQAVPGGTAFYATVYLQPSTGQKLNLQELMSRVPGFGDRDALNQKIHEITARFLREAGIDYEADVRPWLGDQIAIGVRPDGVDPERADVLVVIDVKDRAVAQDALVRLGAGMDEPAGEEVHEGVTLSVAGDTAWALLDDILLVGSSADAVRAGLDADAGRTESLSDSAAFRDAMGGVAPDHLGAVFADLEAFGASAGFADQLGGYSTAALALIVEADGLRLEGSAPFDEGAASESARAAFALSTQPSGLVEWMPPGTQAELVIFGLTQSLHAAEAELGGEAGGDEIADALVQLRAIAALGLGINIDAHVLPLFDRETAVAITGLEGDMPDGLLLMHPSDIEAAAAGLDEMRDSLAQRGAEVDVDEVDGHTVTSVQVPELGTVIYAVDQDVVVLGLSAEDVAAALTAHATGDSLAATERYRRAWDLAGERGGNELWVDAAALVDVAGDDLGVTGEARDILLQAGALAMTAPARPDEARSDFHVVLTVR
jgi:hypothetical protein